MEELYVTLRCTNPIPLLPLFDKKQPSSIFIQPGLRTSVRKDVWEHQKKYNREIITQLKLGMISVQEVPSSARTASKQRSKTGNCKSMKGR